MVTQGKQEKYLSPSFSLKKEFVISNTKEDIKVELITDPVPHIIMRNFYNKEELNLIWKEFDFLTSPFKMKNAKDTGGAIDPISVTSVPVHYGISLDEIYQGDRNISDILRLNRKLFKEELTNAYCQVHPFFKQFKDIINSDATKIKYYENDQDYKCHMDTSRFTAITYFYKEPIAFSGGDLCFNEYNYTIPIENNMVVIFVSCTLHSSTPITMKEKFKRLSGMGKYSIVQFLDHKY
jgi:hypothetical protein